MSSKTCVAALGAFLSVLGWWLLLVSTAVADVSEVELSSLGPEQDLVPRMWALSGMAAGGVTGPAVRDVAGWQAVAANPAVLVAPRRHDTLWLQLRLHNADARPCCAGWSLPPGG